METTTRLFMPAAADAIFALAADTPRWPEILPHYRWVRVLDQAPGADWRVVEMAACRSGIPLRWVAEQRSLPAARRIEFRHVGGVTRGMEVAWTLLPRAGGTLVSIWHRFQPRWPLVPDGLIRLVVGELFVDYVASQTLQRISALAAEEGGPR